MENSKMNGVFFAGLEFPEYCALCPGCTDCSIEQNDSKHFCAMSNDLPMLNEDLIWVSRPEFCTARKCTVSVRRANAVR